MHIVVVDDEAHARRRLAKLLADLPDVTGVQCLDSAAAALAHVSERSVDLAILDVQMPEIDGLSLARMLGEIPVVFTTAHSEFAVDAFELGAVDYLLKPVRIERLAQALERARARRPAFGPEGKFCARSGSSLYFFEPSQALRYYAKDKYSFAHIGAREYLLERSLHQISEELERRYPGRFLRVHRSELIRVDAVASLHQEERGLVVELEDGQRAAVSRRLATELKRRLGLDG